jgi:Xaa-Pro dipeptidase
MTQTLQLCDHFDLSEYAGRIARTREEMERRGLDALLIFAQESMYYLFHYDQAGYWIYQTIILPLKGNPVALVRVADAFLVQEAHFIDDIRTWTDADEDPVPKTGAILADLGCLTGCRIGIESRTYAMMGFFYRQLQEEVERKGGGLLVEASDLVTRLRVHKSPAEVAQMRAAGRILDLTFYAAHEAMRDGVRECEVAAEALRAMHMAGADPSVGPIVLSSGPNTRSFTHFGATRRTMRQGEPVVLEIGANVNRYHAVAATVSVVGQATAGMHDLYQQIRRTLNAGKAALAPGQPVAELARIMGQTLTGPDRSRWGSVHFGYGTGIGFTGNWLDDLKIHARSPYVLAPGMTFFLLSFRLSPDEDYFMLSGDPILITDRGYEELSRLAMEELNIVGGPRT